MEPGPDTEPPPIVEPGDLQPAKAYPPIALVDNDGLRKADMLSFISAAVKEYGLIGHNIDGYNQLVEGGIDRIMTRLFDVEKMLRNERTQTELDRHRKTYQVRLQFHDVRVGYPVCSTYITGKIVDLYPNQARITGLPYSGPVKLSATVSIKAHYDDGRVEEKVAEIPSFQIGGFPIMVGSTRCHTHNCTSDALKGMGEDPKDPGGYFVAKRGEYVVDLLENIRYNAVHVHVGMKPNEHVRAEFLSQPGGAFENSSQVRIRYMVNGQITMEINSTTFKNARLPFFLIYRLFGMMSDRQVSETIVFDNNDEGPITARMLGILEHAFRRTEGAFASLTTELNRETIVQTTAERIAKNLTNPAAYASNENAVQHLNENLLRSLDRAFLPHMGQTDESRMRKLRFIGLVIHKALLVHFGILPPTDRDSYRNKRVHGAGVSLAKAFKTQVNNSVVGPIQRAIRRDLKNNPWESITETTIVDTFRNSLVTSDLNRAMEQAITAGNKTIVVRRHPTTNRVSSQALERKNTLNTYSALRTVVTQNAGNASKQTERADMMRRVHPTYTGFICVAQSADTGENVGMRKQLAITAGVCTAGEPLLLKKRLLADPAVTALDRVTNVEMLRGNLSRIFVNGEWVGFCKEAYELATRYRALRREGRIVDPYATIYCDPITGEIEFWLDVGRLRRPLLIVDSNIAEYNAALRAAHLRRQGGGPPVRGVIIADPATERALGLYYLRAGDYVAFTPLWYARDHDARGYTHNAAESLIAEGLAVRTPPPPAAAEIAKALAERHGGADRVEFTQNTRFTPEHARAIVSGRLTLGDLVREGVAEYITPEEQENCLIAESIEVLKRCRHDVTKQFSHVDVEQSIFGLAALVSPYGNHTQPARVTYETNQGRQTGGWYVLNYPFRADKNRFFQFYNEMPLVRTFTNGLIPANGSNVVIAYASYGGDNQEDSAIVCKASADRGLFAGAFFRHEIAELEKGETFCNPDALTTKGMKPNASYEKLVDGFIRPGSVVRYGDVLIGRVGKPNRGRADERFQYVDRSIIYNLHEPAVVEDALRLRGANDELFGLVKLRYDRPLRTGDKMCLHPSHSVLTGNRGWVGIAEVTRRDTVACLSDGVLTYRHPEAVHSFDVDEDLYEVTAPMVNQCVTLNHRMWVKPRGQPDYLGLQAQSVRGTAVRYKRDAVNAYRDIGVKTCRGLTVPMDQWLGLLGAFLAGGPAGRDGAIRIDVSRAATIEPDLVDRGTGAIRQAAAVGELTSCAASGRLPPYVWTLSQRQCRILLGALGHGTCRVSTGDIMRLALHAGWSANGTDGRATVVRTENEPLVDQASGRRERTFPYKGPVHCITVPGGVFYTCRDGVPGWTCNSSRSGNKSIVALMLQQSDMPFTEDGLTPDIIINTHSFPSRMTIGQLIETSVGKVCARKGVVTDGTAFLPVDHAQNAAELVRLGFRFNGRERMYNGMTGEYFDAAIFIGPTAEQRLQKFVLDDEQSVAGSSPTDATTGQPLGGKHVQGGLRLGEMELWALESHGAMFNQYEKTSQDSDGRVMAVCRNCGSLAVYNERSNIYRCHTCREAADISLVDGSKTAILLHEELAAANINVCLGLCPREFEEH